MSESKEEIIARMHMNAAAPTMKTTDDDPWKHRASGMRCITCMWFVRKASAVVLTGNGIGRCRRHAPTMNGYPVVYDKDWCGDHKLDENKI